MCNLSCCFTAVRRVGLRPARVLLLADDEVAAGELATGGTDDGTHSSDELAESGRGVFVANITSRLGPKICVSEGSHSEVGHEISDLDFTLRSLSAGRLRFLALPGLFPAPTCAVEGFWGCACLPGEDRPTGSRLVDSPSWGCGWLKAGWLSPPVTDWLIPDWDMVYPQVR